MFKSIGTGADGLIDPPEGEKCLTKANGRGMNAPPDCIYSMAGNSTGDGVKHRHCGYILKGDNGSRGCDVGPGCIRYDNGKKKKPPTKGVGPAWDVARGRQMWIQGATYGAIAEKVGTSRASVERRARMYWKNGRD